MNRSGWWSWLTVPVVFILGAGAVWAAPAQVSLYALFQDKAILTIDGARRLLAVGEASPEGVRLLTTDTRGEQAEVEIGGRRETLRLGLVTGGAPPAASPRVTLHGDFRGFFHAEGHINHRPVRFLVDTGANTVVINGTLARRLGLDFQRTGQRSVATTASGQVPIYLLKLDSVRIGEIEARYVDTAVIDGREPQTPLLGASFLRAVELRLEGNRMELIGR